MKKSVIWFLAGALFMFSGQALAETISNVGEKIDSEVELRLDGSEVGTAAIVNGKSYAEVRKVAEAMGLSVSYDSSGIDLTSKHTDEEVVELIKYLSNNKTQIEKQIEKYNNIIANAQTVLLPKYQKEYDDETNEFLKSQAQVQIDKLNEDIQGFQEKISDYQQQITEIDQQLSKLEAQQ